MDVDDPLKDLDSITQPDPRYRGMPGGLEAMHANLQNIRLHDGVPLQVRQQFETAKNLSLYSWFAYRFHSVSQLFAYTCLERALKERMAQEPALPKERRPRTFRPLLELAAAEGWIKNECFDVVRRAARVQLKDEQLFAMIESGLIEDEVVEPPDIEEAAVLARARKLDYVHRISKSMPQLRNHLAHGQSLLHGGSAATLRVVAEAINQLFDPITRSSA